MNIDLILWLIGAAASGAIWLSSTVLKSYRELEAMRKQDNEAWDRRIERMETRIDKIADDCLLLKNKEQLYELSTQHEIDLINQRTIAALENINVKLAVQEKCLNALHKRLDADGKRNFSDGG